MASLTFDKNGNASIYVKLPSGKRRPVRLGKVGKQRAERTRDHVGELEGARLRGIEPALETRAWLGALADDELRDRLAACGFCEAASREASTLRAVADTWEAMKAKTVKPSTLTRLKLSTATLVEYFRAERHVATIRPGDADEWRAWALGERERRLCEATLRKRTSDAVDLFAFAARKGLYRGDNPFAHLPSANVTDTTKQRYIDEATARCVLDAIQGAGSVPTWELRLLFSLARWGGLRVPSEPRVMTWADVDFDAGRLHVDSPKTGPRVVPMFPELRPLLLEAFEQADEGAVHVLPSLQRLTMTALRKQTIVAIKRAGLVAWPKLWVNLRSSRETDLADRFPLHAVVSWIGNSEPVARKHYLQVTDDHFAAATEAESGGAVRKAVRAGDASGRTDHGRHAKNRTEAQEDAGNTYLMAGLGLEPCPDSSGKPDISHPSGAQSGARGHETGQNDRLADALAAIHRLPLSDAEKAEAVRRLLSEDRQAT